MNAARGAIRAGGLLAAGLLAAAPIAALAQTAPGAMRSESLSTGTAPNALNRDWVAQMPSLAPMPPMSTAPPNRNLVIPQVTPCDRAVASLRATLDAKNAYIRQLEAALAAKNK